MNILLPQISTNKHFSRYVTNYLTALTLFQGKANWKNLERHGASSRRTADRWTRSEKDFDAPTFNINLLKQEKVLSNELILALDDTFLKKSGRHTEKIGRWRNGSANRVENGLNLSVLGVIDCTENTGYALDAQLHSKEEKEAFQPSLSQLEDNKEELLKLSKILVVDGVGMLEHPF